MRRDGKNGHIALTKFRNVGVINSDDVVKGVWFTVKVPNVRDEPHPFRFYAV